MKYIKLLSVFLFLVFQLHAEVEEKLSVKIKELEYTRPTRGVGIAGKFAFESFIMSTKDMSVNISNKKEIFDSKLFIRPNFVGVKADNGTFGFGFPLVENHAFKNILNAKLIESSILMDSQRIVFNADLFKIEQKGVGIQVKNFGLFCKKHPKYLVNDFFSIMYGCLHESYFNGKRSGELSDAQVTLTSIEKGSKLELKGLIDKLNFENDKIRAVFDKSSIAIDDDFFVRSDALKMRCAKESIDINNFDIKEITRKCVSDIKIEDSTVVVEDKRSSKGYFIDINEVGVKEENFYLDMKSFQRVSDKVEKGSITVMGLKMNCFKENSETPFNKVIIINNCLKKASLQVEEVIDAKKKNFIFGLFNHYKTLLINQFKDPTTISKKKKVKLKKLDLNLENNLFELIGKIKPIMFFHKFEVTGSVNYLEESEQIVLTIKDVDLPIPVFGRSLKLAMFLIDLFIDSESNIEVDKKNKKIYIRLSNGEKI